MKHVVVHKTQKLVFRRWSRKKYAIFTSLHKEVAIGHLNCDIACNTILKSENKTCFNNFSPDRPVYTDSSGDDDLPVFVESINSI